MSIKTQFSLETLAPRGGLVIVCGEIDSGKSAVVRAIASAAGTVVKSGIDADPLLQLLRQEDDRPLVLDEFFRQAWTTDAVAACAARRAPTVITAFDAPIGRFPCPGDCDPGWVTDEDVMAQLRELAQEVYVTVRMTRVLAEFVLFSRVRKGGERPAPLGFRVKPYGRYGVIAVEWEAG